MLGLIWLRFPLSTCLPCGCFALLYLQHNMLVISNNRSSLHQWQVIVSTQLKTDRSDSCADKTVLHGIYCAATAATTDGELWSLTHKCAYAITTETSAPFSCCSASDCVQIEVATPYAPPPWSRGYHTLTWRSHGHSLTAYLWRRLRQIVLLPGKCTVWRALTG